MSILLELFLTFLKIGVVSFGGGYGMISLVREEVINHGWLTAEEFTNFIAVAEATPGPIAINMATFIGSTEAGIVGALLATLGVVLPAFLIILLIASVLKNFLKRPVVQSFLNGVKPVVCALIIITALTMGLERFFNIETVNSTFNFDWKALLIFGVIVIIHYTFKLGFKKKVSPIILIVVSACLGIVFYKFLI